MPNALTLILATAAVIVLRGFFNTFYSFIFWEDKTVPKSIKGKKRNLLPHERDYLTRYNSYYNDLPEALKPHFEKRVLYFINHNKFIPRSYTHVNEEMQVLIASAAVQLTFGFKAMHFPHFWRILIYQDDYYSKITRKYHKGEVNPGGFIVLSWRNIHKGFSDPEDGRNLALHEMAHALHLENGIRNQEFGFFPRSAWSDFQHLAEEEMHKMRRSQSYLFRAYAKVNFHEFFAVAIENFFERPSFFSEEAPELYKAMAKLLQQDPLDLEVSLVSSIK
jgi:hypothetical protein